MTRKTEPFLKVVKLFVISASVWTFGYSEDVPGVGTVLLLESHPSYSVVLPISADNPGEYEKWLLVQAPRFHRVMAVIQYLNLSPTNDFACTRSYLQFQDGANVVSDKMCGNFDPDESTFDPPSFIGSRSYKSTRQSLKVHFVHKSSKALTSYARIAFTAFRDDCYFHEGKDGGHPRYRPCEYLTNQDGIGRQCIVSNLFCDTILHCGGLDAEGKDFGFDETVLNCPHLSSLQEGSSGSYSVQVNSSTNATAQVVQSIQVDSSGDGVKGSGARNYKSFFDEREEHLANLFKTAMIGFVGICTICILTAFVLSMFCRNYSK